MKRNLTVTLICGLVVLLAHTATVQAEEAKKVPAAKPAAAAPHAATVVVPHALNAQEHHEAVKGHEVERGHELARDHHEVVRAHHEFRVHDVHKFNHAELARWRGGRWENRCFEGRCGHWWFAGGQWYFYGAAAMVGYPLAVAEVTFLEPVVAAPVVIAPVVQAPMPVAPAAAAQVWYYCDNPPGYFPYVKQCNTQFREVAAKPAGR